MYANQKRIERAWQNLRGWITEFDGSATQTYLTNISTDILLQAVKSLAEQSANFRVATISGEEEVQSQIVRPETIQENLARLLTDEIAELNINYVASLEGLDLDIHMVVNTVGGQKVDLEIVWWSDQVFSDLEEAENFSYFQTLMEYFIALQELFNAQKLYVGPETFDRPRPGSDQWEEI